MNSRLLGASSIAFVSFLLIGAPLARAQDHGRGACREDAEKLCASEAASHDRAAVRACLNKNLEKVSAPCRERLTQPDAAPSKK
jgi:hypothetical protein